MALAFGELGPSITFDEDELQHLIATAVGEGRPAVVWSTLDDEVVVDVFRTRVAIREGLVLVGLRLWCDQEPDGTELVVPLAVGSRSAPAGMVATAEATARGASALVVGVWGPSAVAAAWSALLRVCQDVVLQADPDARGRTLLPGAMEAEIGVLTVVAQARHAIDDAALDEIA